MRKAYAIAYCETDGAMKASRLFALIAIIISLIIPA